MSKLSAIPGSRLLHRFYLALAGMLIVASGASADLLWDKVGEALGKSGTVVAGGVYRGGLPRTDLKVTLDGIDIKPGVALGD